MLTAFAQQLAFSWRQIGQMPSQPEAAYSHANMRTMFLLDVVNLKFQGLRLKNWTLAFMEQSDDVSRSMVSVVSREPSAVVIVTLTEVPLTSSTVTGSLTCTTSVSLMPMVPARSANTSTEKAGQVPAIVMGKLRISSP